MVIILAIMSSVLAAIGYASAVAVIKDRYELVDASEKRWFLSGRIMAAGAVECIGVGIVCFIRIPTAEIFQLVNIILLTCFMAVLSVTDGIKHLVPNKILIAMLMAWGVVMCMYLIFDTTDAVGCLLNSLTGAIVGGVIFLFCYLISHRQLGAGDVKLAFVMGLFLTGQRIIGAIFYGTLLCCIYSLIQLARRKLGMKSGVPLVPFLYLGTLITLCIV